MSTSNTKYPLIATIIGAIVYGGVKAYLEATPPTAPDSSAPVTQSQTVPSPIVDEGTTQPKVKPVELVANELRKIAVPSVRVELSNDAIAIEGPDAVVSVSSEDIASLGVFDVATFQRMLQRFQWVQDRCLKYISDSEIEQCIGQHLGEAENRLYVAVLTAKTGSET